MPIALAVLVVCGALAPAEARPNLVLFLADDLSWADVSVYGGPIPTPNLERLAARGMTFTHAFVASPSCAPSRAALLTGLDPVRNGAMFNHQPPQADIKKWPAYFQELGYDVVAFGKVAHYAQVRDYGFDHVARFGYHQDDCVEVAVRWLDGRTSVKPLCVLVGTNWPHVPWPDKAAEGQDGPPPSPLFDTPETRAARGRYAAAVATADRDLGLLYDSARRTLGDDVLFAFTSDHGAQFPFGKWNLTESGLRTPLIVAWPGHVAAGSRSDALVSWIDLLPTYIEAAGGTPPATGTGAGEIDGRSFLPVLLGTRPGHRDVVFGTHSGDGTMNEYPMRTVRDRDWRYVRNLDPAAEFHTHIDKAAAGDGRAYWDSWVRAAQTDPAAAAVVRRYHARPAEELYDLRADPQELRNLAADPSHAATLARLRGALDARMRATGDEGLATERAVKPSPKKPAAKKPPR